MRPYSPCVGICSATALGDEICRGCGRTFDEVINWNQLTDEQRSAVWDRLTPNPRGTNHAKPTDKP